FSEEKKKGVYEAIYKRRDIRNFKDTPVPEETLMKILDAAHHAPSVGYSQPWNFIVIKDIETRKKIKASFNLQKKEAGEFFEGERKEKYDSFKLEGILDSPINICITCDRQRFGPYIIGKHSILETDLYSVVCAVQNMWLAARAEGIGVGWVSILKNEEIHQALKIPQDIIPVAYLCIGYPKEFSEIPLLEKEKWAPRIGLEDIVHYEQWEEEKNNSLQLDQEHELIA
ncbi:MAG: 5,6-dimethylbenzimidazole synthase, partial [Nitrospinae bacterium]|nr:5,6-dimethylbenzimidazole synthase [Nitrospinota bacterium]